MKIRISLLLVLIALFAGSSFAQDGRQIMLDVPVEDGGWSGEVSYSNGQYMDNPCTYWEDWVWVDYSAYVEGAEIEAGASRYLFAESTSMGGTYAASGASRTDVAYTQSFALRQYHKVNTPDDFHVVTVINFDAGSKTSWVSVETACGNGTPDSLQ
jgi:hypothetical protein